MGATSLLNVTSFTADVALLLRSFWLFWPAITTGNNIAASITPDRTPDEAMTASHGDSSLASSAQYLDRFFSRS